MIYMYKDYLIDRIATLEERNERLTEQNETLSKTKSAIIRKFKNKLSKAKKNSHKLWLKTQKEIS